MKTKIKFYSGLDTIGGVIMEIKYDKDRVFLEAGTAYNPAFDMFDGTVNKRNDFISDYLWINEIPMINGIYSKEYIVKYPNLKDASCYLGHQAFFVSHLHLDHMRMMGMIDNSIPVYLTDAAKKLEMALEDVNGGVESIRNDNYSIMPNETKIGEILVKRFVINPNSYQDLSFYIETPDLKIHYTGDVFVYGKYRDNLENVELPYINSKKPDLLVCEGTRFYFNETYDKVEHSLDPLDDLLTIDEVHLRIINKIESFDGLCVFNFYNREMNDVMYFENYAKETNRELVFEPDTAYIINKFFNKPVNYLIPDTYTVNPNYFDYLANNCHEIDKTEILANPNKYIVQNSYANILELFDYRKIKTLYLHQSGTPLGAFDPKYNRLKTFLNRLDNLEYFNCWVYDDKWFSSHATKYQILGYIDKVEASLVIPAHSGNRKEFYKHITKPKYLCELNKTYIYNRELNTLEEVDYE